MCGADPSDRIPVSEVQSVFPSPPAHPAMPPGRLMTALAALVLVLAACTGSAGPSPVASSSTAIATAAPTATPLPTPTATPVAAFPATLKDDEGTSVTIASEPKRIVSLTPATTEILFGLGAGDRVVATDDGSDYPAAAANLKHVATFSSVDTEQVVQLGADLVLAGGLGFTPADAITKLRSLKIPVLVIYAPSVDGVLKDIELIGAAVGATDEAKTMTDGMSTQLKAISDAAAARATTAGAKPRVYYEIGYRPDRPDLRAGGQVVPRRDGHPGGRRADHDRRSRTRTRSRSRSSSNETRR